LKYFCDAVRPFYETVVPVASRQLLSNVGTSYGFEREFEFYYYDQIKLDAPRREPKARLSSSAPSSDVMLNLAVQDLTHIFEKYSITEADAIFFPSVDYYGAMALLESFLHTTPERSPSALFRFIGVMESATSVGEPGLPRLKAKIKSILRKGYRIKICAETPRYADSLAESLNSVVSVVPYPANSKVIPPPSDLQEEDMSAEREVYRVVCPGSARLDKGYLLLFDIFSAVRKIDPKQSIRFVTQALPIADALTHTHYTNQLYAIPGVKILPSSLSENEMDELYRLADLILLPYDPVTYAYRGSAVFMECISRGIPVVALAGSAFCDQISYYGAGSIVPNSSNFVQEILRYRNMSARTVATRLAQARYRYVIDADLALAHWIAL
jgi:glycosyltransferase involved in cell wall biosynthesis